VVRTVGGKMFGPLSAQAKGGNFVFSPASLAIALGMVRSGARGEVARQLDAFLGTTSMAQLAQAMNAVDQRSTALGKPGKNYQGHTGEVALWSANSLWGQDGVTWERPFLGTLASRFGTGVRQVDYVDDAEGARKLINQWVSDQTKGKIPQLIPAGALGADAVMTMVNALYFKAPWFHPFAEPSSPAPFHRIDGSVVQAPLMTGGGQQVTHLRGAGWTAVRLPYAGQKLAMTVIVPDAGSFAAVQGKLGAGVLSSALRGRYTTSEGSFALPKFDIRTKGTLTGILRALGVTAPFEGGHDFDPMSRALAGKIQVKEIRQEATITVDEKGTEAAAATSVEFIATAGAVDPFNLTVDRPFVYVVHDLTTGTPLFIGQVMDPTAKG